MNTPFFSALPKEEQAGYQEVWYLKLNPPGGTHALWLRFTLLTSQNGFKRVAETWGIAFHRMDGGEIRKQAVKQTQDLAEFLTETPFRIRIGESTLSDTDTRGTIVSKGKSLKWDFKMSPRATASFDFVPRSLARARVIRNHVLTPHEDHLFTGWYEVDGERVEMKDAPGMQGHLAGSRNGHSWTWGHCNTFLDEAGGQADLIFDGLSARARVAGGLPTPALTCLYFRYQGKDYAFNTFWDAIRTRSSHSLTEWTFQAERDDLSFRGVARAQHRDFAGVTYEDTDGSYLYCNNSKLSDLEIRVYRKGKLEATFRAPGTAAFEVVSRERNPYVPLLI